MRSEKNYRLLCSYSLATPPKGSNVSAGELLQSLMQTKDSMALASALKNKWLKKLNAIVENGIDETDISGGWIDACGIRNDDLSSKQVEDNVINGDGMSGVLIIGANIAHENHVSTTDDDENILDRIKKANHRKSSRVW